MLPHQDRYSIMTEGMVPDQIMKALDFAEYVMAKETATLGRSQETIPDLA